jgi:hypothetical protein
MLVSKKKDSIAIHQFTNDHTKVKTFLKRGMFSKFFYKKAAKKGNYTGGGHIRTIFYIKNAT